MIKVVASITIDRPIKAVFAYMKNPENQSHWQPALHDVRHSSGDRKGGTITEIRKVMGRQVEHTLAIIDFQENTLISARGEASSHEGAMERHLTFEEVMPTTTRVTMELGIDARGALKEGEPILHRMMQRHIDSDLQHLKDILEAHEDLHAAAARLPEHRPGGRTEPAS